MPAPLKRPNFFNGQILTAGDLRAEQQYHQDKRRLLNRMLHGYGVVCGLRVIPNEPPDPVRVVVEAGLAIDTWGREVVIHEPVELDLSTCPGAEKSRGSGGPKRRFVTLEYDEQKTDWVPLAGSGAEESSQPSRIEEGFRLSIRSEPVGCANREHDEILEAMAEVFRAGGSSEARYRRLAHVVSRPCAPRPRDAALTLAAVDPGSGVLTEEQIDNLSHRRIVLSPAAVLETVWLGGAGLASRPS